MLSINAKLSQLLRRGSSSSNNKETEKSDNNNSGSSRRTSTSSSSKAASAVSTFKSFFSSSSSSNNTPLADKATESSSSSTSSSSTASSALASISNSASLASPSSTSTGGGSPANQQEMVASGSNNSRRSSTTTTTTSSSNSTSDANTKDTSSVSVNSEPLPASLSRWRGGKKAKKTKSSPPTVAANNSSTLPPAPICSTSSTDNAGNVSGDNDSAENQSKEQAQQSQADLPILDQFAMLELMERQEEENLKKEMLKQLEEPPKVLKEGWVYKKGQHITNWRSRYLVLLDNGSLLGFKERPPPGVYNDPLNDFALHDARIMKVKVKKNYYGFRLRGSLQWTSGLEAERAFVPESRHERDDWVAVITELITERLPRLEDFEKLALPTIKKKKKSQKGSGDKNKKGGGSDKEVEEVEDDDDDDGIVINFGGKKNPFLSNPFKHRRWPLLRPLKIKHLRLNSVQLANRLKARKAAVRGHQAEVSLALAKAAEERRQRTISFKDFDIRCQIGRGSFGKVLLGVERRTGKTYALKMLEKTLIITKDEVAHTMTENQVLQKTKHPFIVGLKYSFQTGSRMCFVLEYVNGGELFYHLSRDRIFSQSRTRFYGAQLLLALEYLHAKNIIYRDLKLENILLDKDGNVKIADFGLCKEYIYYGATTRTFCGTPEYLAPEVLEEANYGRAVDWWGLGVVMYEMLVGRLPFVSYQHDVLFEKILIAEVAFPPTVSPQACSLLGGLLQKDPSRRLGGGPSDAREIMLHPFFKDVPWADVFAKKIKPPYDPGVTDDQDLRYFDPTFTREPVELETPPERRRQLKLQKRLEEGREGDTDSINSESDMPYFTQFSYTAASIASVEQKSLSELFEHPLFS